MPVRARVPRRSVRRQLRILAVVLLAAALVVTTDVQRGDARSLGPLRMADPTLVRDGERWVSLATNERASGTQAKPCDPDDQVWDKGFAYVPYRVGPAPEQQGDCWAGDALPGGPGPWANKESFRQWAPSVAKIGDAWWLAYAAQRSGSGQQCIGVAASNSPTGPGWFHATDPLVCPSGGRWAIDPELFYDRQTRRWYMLWRQDPGTGCETALYIQQFDTSGGGLTGTRRRLLSSFHRDLGFDEAPGAPQCPGGVSQVIENPTMVRADSGQLWLFFSANNWASGNYATGWAVCGAGSPVAGDGCGLVNSFDPRSRYRPAWGWSQRTAPVSDVNARPYLGFPDLPGFGGMSLATPNPTAGGRQPVYATAHVWDEANRLRTQHVFRLDTTGTKPALYEPETVAVHGRDGTFGGVRDPAPSGQSLATRAVRGWGWPRGRDGIFNAVTGDGTVFTSGNDQNAGFFVQTADDMVISTYDPGASTYGNVNIKTTAGKTAIPPVHDPNGDTWPAGASVAEVETVDDGNAVAFTAMLGYPSAYTDRPAPAEGIWPTFGILTKVNDRWQVASGDGWQNQWTGGELSRSNTASDVDERACPRQSELPDTESLCRGPNEMAVAPRSGDVLVAQYLGAGLAALRIDGPGAGGRYNVKVNGSFEYPKVKNFATPDPDDYLSIAPKTVVTDPSSSPGDERFTVVFDIFPLGTPGVIQEFTYDSRNGGIRPTSPPFFIGPEGSNLRSLGTGLYDHQGNLWAQSGTLAVYAKIDGRRRPGGPECPLEPGEFDPNDYTTTYTTPEGASRRAWGLACRPDYEILQPKDVGLLQLSEDPRSRTIVGVDTWGSGDVLAIRHAGAGRAKTFTIGSLVDPGRDLLPRAGAFEQRPGAFDKTGRLWFAIDHRPTNTRPCDRPPGERCPGVPPYQSRDHWMFSVDAGRLFDPAPVVLSGVSGKSAIVEAEQTTTTSTAQRPGVAGTILVDSTAYMRKCRWGWGTDNCAPAPDPPGYSRDGFELADDADGAGHRSGAVGYRVYAPKAGIYQVVYRARAPADGARIQLEAGGSTWTTSIPKGGWGSVDGPRVQLAAGEHTLRLSPPAGGGNWFLNRVSLTRL